MNECPRPDRPRRSARRGWLAWVLALVVMAPALAAAQDQPRIPNARTTFQGYFQPGHWAQVVARVENPTDRAILGDVVLRTSDPDRGAMLFAHEVWLPARSGATVWLPVRPGASGEGSGDRGVLTVSQTIDLLDAQRGHVLHRDTDLRMQHPARRVALVAYIDDGPFATYSFLQTAPGFAAVRTSRADTPPDRWYGYEPLAMLVVGRADLGRLRPSQIQAILDWTARGGVLLIGADTTTEELLLSPLGQAAGVGMAGYGTVRQVSPEGADAPIALPADMPRLTLIPSEAQVVAWADGLPLLTHNRWGLGHAFVLALPTAALDQAGLAGVLGQINEALRTAPALRPERFEQASLTQLQKISGRPGLGRWQVLAWLTGYTLVVAGLGLVLNFRGRGELTWLILLPVAALLGVALFAYARMQTEQPSLSYIGLAVNDTTGRTVLYNTFSPYSPDTISLDVSAGAPTGRVMPTGQVTSASLAETRIRQAGTMGVPAVEVPADSAPAFTAAAAIDLPGSLDGALTFGPTGLAGELTNRTGLDIQDAVLLVYDPEMGRTRAFGIGALPAGQAVAVADLPPLTRGYLPKAFYSEQDQIRNALVADLTSVEDLFPAPRPDGQAYLMGWAQSNPLQPLPGHEMPTGGELVYLQPARLAAPAAGTRVRLMPGMAVLEVEGLRRDRQSGQYNPNANPARFDLLLSPPAPLGALQNTEATLELLFDAPTFRVTVYGVDPVNDRELTELASFDNPVAAQTIPIERADRFMNADGAIRLRVRVEPLTAAVSLENRKEWQIKSIDGTLEGTVQ